MLGRGHFGKVVEGGSGCDNGSQPGGLNRNIAGQKRSVAVQIWNNKPSPEAGNYC